MKVLFSFLIAFSLFSCTSTNNSNELLDEEKMTEVLQEVMLLENYYQTKYGSPSVYKDALDSSVEVVFKRFNTNKNQFSKSFDFYAQDPEVIKRIQAKIIENLNSKHL
jgi:hypothetical protein